MNNKHYLGKRVSSLDLYDEIGPITGVALIVQGAEEEKEFLAEGSDTSGYVLEIPYPYSHQGQLVANTIFESVRGKTYKGFRATGARFDPMAELGDAVTVDGIYSMMAYRRANFGPNHASEIAAPGENAVQHEYSAGGGASSEVRRLKAEAYSLISKTAEEIRLEVSGKMDEETATSLISQKMDSIELSVSSANGSTTFTLTSDGAELSTKTLELSVDAVNITGKLTADQINATGLKVDAANVTGTLTIGQMPDGVATTDSIASEVESVATSQGYVTSSGVLSITKNAGYVTSNQVTTITNNAISTATISADQITTGTLNAAVLELDGLLWLTKNGYGYGFMGVNTSKGGPVISDAGGNVFIVTTSNAAKLSYYEENMIWVASGTNGCYSSKTMQVYSDQRMKNSIDYGMEKYESMFQALKPCTYKYNNEGENARVRFGFVAQEVMAAAADNGLTENDYSLVGEYDGMYTIGYGEMAAWNTYMIQKLMARVSELEGKVNDI